MNSPVSVAARRLARARARLAELELDGVLISYLPNVRYLTGFSGSNGWLLLGSSQVIFATDGRYEQQAEEELADDLGCELLVPRDGFLAELAKRAGQEYGGTKVGFEGQHVSYSDWARLKEEAATAEWTAVTGIVEDLRAVKDQGEIAAMERAADIAAAALRDILPLVEPGVREFDIAAELDYRMSRLGADGPAFETIVASGERTALPHAATSEREIQEGDLVLCDFGARWAGYCCDLTRTFVVGEPAPRQTEVYGLVLAAQREASAALREGATGEEVDAAARQVFASEDHEARFPHGTGHGLGLEVHEVPRLGRQSEERLKTNMVVTVEPGLYFPGWGGIRIEDDLVVAGDRPRPLVDLERDRLQALPL